MVCILSTLQKKKNGFPKNFKLSLKQVLNDLESCYVLVVYFIGQDHWIIIFYNFTVYALIQGYWPRVL